MKRSNINNNDMWQAFYAEVSTQLETLEQILSDHGAENSADIHHLFREFHTIKSSCAMMEFHGMANVAHASEDFLDLVRKGRAALNASSIRDLLRGIDWLKAQLENTRTTGNAPPDITSPDCAALIEILRTLSATAEENLVDEAGGERLSEDEIREFASACQQELLTGLAPDTDPLQGKRALNKLANICNLVGFSQLSALLKKHNHYRAANDKENTASTTAAIVEQVIAIEKNYRVDCGSSAFQPDEASQPATGSVAGNVSATLRVDSDRIDGLIKQVRELGMTYNFLSHVTNDSVFAQDKFLHTLDKMQQSIASIRLRILDLRVVPVSSVFNRIPALVTKMAATQQKDINLVIKGKDVRIDKGMVDILMEPLIHLVRNCIDHGMELPAERVANGKPATATLTLSAFQEGSTLTLDIADDGRGINLEKVLESGIRKGFVKATETLSEKEICQLIFLPGFSTTDVITETSGRGVGMDVVITRMKTLGGNIDVQSVPGHGTRFSMTLPLSAAIQGVVVFTANSRQFAIPQHGVVELVAFTPYENRNKGKQASMVYRDEVLPLFSLHGLTLESGYNDNNSSNDPGLAIVLGDDKKRIALHVDSIEGREDVFVRELHEDLRTMPAICGATVRGHGEVVFILNSHFLLQSA